MPPKEIICTECEHISESKTPYCADCGAEYPWKKEPKYSFAEEDLPIVFPYEVEDTNWELWDAFCEYYFDETNVDGRHIDGFPRKFPKMESVTTTLWFVVTESYELEGPFVDEPKMFTAHGHSILIDDD